MGLFTSHRLVSCSGPSAPARRYGQARPDRAHANDWDQHQRAVVWGERLRCEGGLMKGRLGTQVLYTETYLQQDMSIYRMLAISLKTEV